MADTLNKIMQKTTSEQEVWNKGVLEEYLICIQEDTELLCAKYSNYLLLVLHNITGSIAKRSESSQYMQKHTLYEYMHNICKKYHLGTTMII